MKAKEVIKTAVYCITVSIISTIISMGIMSIILGDWAYFFKL